jgi:acyl dehydratase
MVDKGILGKSTPAFRYQLSREKIREYVIAIGEKNPFYTKEEVAKKAGFPTVIAPPTAVSIMMYEPNLALVLDPDLKIDLSKFLHGGQDYEFLRPIVAGETLYSQSKVVDIIAKEAMDLVMVETTVATGDGEKVVIGKGTFILRR